MSAPARRRPKKHEEEEHENHERWLVSYADMLTLLFALFIVLFAISQVDQKKFAELKSGLSSFGNADATIVLPGGQSLSDDAAVDTTGTLSVGATANPAAIQTAAQAQAAQTAAQTAVNAADLKKLDAQRQRVEEEVAKLEADRKAMTAELAAAGLAGTAKFTYDDRGLVVTIVTSDVVFGPNAAVLLPGGQKVVSAIAPTLATLPNNLAIDGHTNQLQVSTGAFASGWDLSASRAVAVLRYLTETKGIADTRVSATGYGDERPLIPGTSAEANRVNRRVDIVILSSLAPADSALIPSFAPEASQL